MRAVTVLASLGRAPLVSVLIAVQLAGCAGRVSRPATMTEERFTEAQTTCNSAAASGVDTAGAKSALGAGALAGLAMAVEGAAEGAKWGAISGGGAGYGAWIGAAAGMGIGVMVGLVMATKKGFDAYRGYRTGYERCMTAELQPASPPPQSETLEP